MKYPYVQAQTRPQVPPRDYFTQTPTVSNPHPTATTMSTSLRLVRHQNQDASSPFMDLPAEIRCEIYKYLLTVEHGAGFAIISVQEFRYRATIRELRRGGSPSISRDRKEQVMTGFQIFPTSVPAFKSLFKYNGEDNPLLHVDILRACRQVHHEAQSIIYDCNSFSIDPCELPINVPLHRQFPDGWVLSKIRYIRLELGYSDRQGCPRSSRAYGRWSTFLLLPALREVHFLIRFRDRLPYNAEKTWDLSTFHGKTIRGIVAAILHSIKLSGASLFQAGVTEGDKEDFATMEQVSQLMTELEDIRGTDAELWKNDMECMGQSENYRISRGEVIPPPRMNEMVKKR
ncbi:hypothetical protein HBI62_070840 [Parastagonospora nodorum]|nr:hypothetical protein HBI62_070840 [Parastagonospora nodorum]KAH6163134.1 hypothetical protein HBI63_037540 [Parastagonospora nodorum]KAH6183776.1 hypothetical protein HBI61_070690 [Parastagonospora nodorum]